MIRYADDFIITGKNKDILEVTVKKSVEDFLRMRGLTLSHEKTKVTSLRTGVDFLGQTIRKYGRKIIIKPARSSMTRLLTRVRYLIGCHRTATQEQVITKLNPQVRGWSYYHRHVCSRKAFEK